MTFKSASALCLSLTALFLAASTAGCGDSAGVVAPGPASPVSNTTPADGATDAALNSSFAVTFAEPMDAATITTSTFTVAGPGGAAVAGSVSYSGVTALFTPSADLAANTAYTATLHAGVKTAAGVVMAESISWKVTTAAATDKTKPTVSATVPANAGTGVSLDANLTATFSETLDASTVTAASFTLKRGTTAVPGVVTYAGVTATFNPSQSLAAGASYTATLTSVKDLAGNALASSYAWTFTTGATADTTKPGVVSTIPADGATAVTTNSAITATFSEAMAAATLTTTSFKVAAGAQAVAGTVSSTGMTATFRPAAVLASSTLFTATLTVAATDLAGNALAASHSWSFTTGAAPDTAAPTVTSTLPLGAATGVLATASLKATFSEAMAPQTINSSTFTLNGPGGPVAGSVVFDAPNKTATFQAQAALAAGASYTAKVKGGSGGVTDLAGNQLATDYTWSFTTGAPVGLAPVLLGSSANFLILAKTAISTVPSSILTGDLGLSPAAASYITGFGLTAATGYATSPQVTGKIYAADYASPTPTMMTTAVSDMETAYTDAAGRPTPDFLELSTGAIGGLTLAPGLYKWTSTVTIDSDVTFAGGPTAVWILQVSGDLTMAAAKHVFLSGGAQAKNIFWQIAGEADLGTTSHFEGILLSQTAINLKTGATMNGRLLAQSAVSLDSSTVTQPAP
jgi:hypothetical protein